MASALQAAHAKGIVHRDIKAGNVLWDLDTGRALVTDWGIAALDSTMDLAPETRLTKTGMFIGSPQYMSPEQLAGDEVGPETDIYSLGLLAFELLTGRGPYAGETPREVMISHLREEPMALSDVRDDVDPDFAAAVARCLAKTPGDRPTAESLSRRFAPGTDSQLEWPPPGLEPLLGRFTRSSLPLGAGSVLLALAVTEHLVFAAPAWDAYLGSQGLPGGAVLVRSACWAIAGVLSLLTGLWLLFRAGIHARAAVGLGYGWMTVLETLADGRGDAGLLIAGDREYAGLKEAERTRLRKGRIGHSITILLAAFLPLILLPSFLALSSALALGAPAILYCSLSPSVLIVLAGTLWKERWANRLRPVRRAFARRSRKLETLSPLVRPWYAVFDAVRGGSLPARGDQGRGWLGPLASGVVGGGLVLGLFVVGMYCFLAIAFPNVLAVTLPRFSTTQEKYEVVNRVRWLRPPLDSTAGPQEAGALLGAITEMDADAAWTVERVADSTIPGSDLLDSGPFGPPYRLNLDSIFVLAQRGLSPAEKAYLAGFAGDPRLPLLERLAELPTYDPTWTVTLGEGDLFYSLPFPTYSRIREVAYHNMARAGLAVSNGDYEAAERFMQQNLSAGLLMADNAHWLIEALIGTVVGGMGARGLEQIYRARGDHELAARMQMSWGVSVQEEPADQTLQRLERADAEENPLSIVQMLTDTTSLRSIRWEQLAFLPLIHSCATFQWVLRGPPPRFTQLLEQIQPQLVRYPGEDALLRSMVETADRISAMSWEEYRDQMGVSSERGALLAWLGEVASRLTGNPRLDACTKVVASAIRN